MADLGDCDICGDKKNRMQQCECGAKFCTSCHIDEDDCPECGAIQSRRSPNPDR